MTSLTLVRRIAARPSLPVVSAQVDARIGGGYRVRFRTLDGGEHEAHGEFLDVSPPRRLVMTWAFSIGGEPEELGQTSLIEIEVRPIHGGSELTFTHSQLRNEASLASHRAGWAGALDKLVAQLGQAPD